MILNKKIYVDTPDGKRTHGWLGTHGKHPCFLRKVSERDKMKIFDAWSINPSVLKKIKNKVDGLIYLTDSIIYAIGIDDALLNGFEKTFKGGTTTYIQLKYWKKYDRRTNKKI